MWRIATGGLCPGGEQTSLSAMEDILKQRVTVHVLNRQGDILVVKGKRAWTPMLTPRPGCLRVMIESLFTGTGSHPGLVATDLPDGELPAPVVYFMPVRVAEGEKMVGQPASRMTISGALHDRLYGPLGIGRSVVLVEDPENWGGVGKWDPDRLVSMSDLQAALDVSASTLQKWKHLSYFPEPVKGDGGRSSLYRWSEVEVFLLDPGPGGATGMWPRRFRKLNMDRMIELVRSGAIPSGADDGE